MAKNKKLSYTLTPDDHAVVLKIQARLSKIFGKISAAGVVRFALRRYLDQLNGGDK
jgi:hypothetical protein